MKNREVEMEAVRTTIVGGRPPGCGRSNIAVPRGMEVLVKKASVDEEFRRLLLARRGEAAAAIGLELDPAERAMLGVIPEEQLARIIGQTVVPAEQRRVFVGGVAAAMLAVLGVGLASCERDAGTATPGTGPTPPASQGAGVAPQAPDESMPVRGLRMDRPPAVETPAASQGAGVAPQAPEVIFMTIDGIRADRPATVENPGATQPTAVPADRDTAPIFNVLGTRIDRPPTTGTQPATGTASASQAGEVPLEGLTAGLRMDRPPQVDSQPAVRTITVPVPTEGRNIPPTAVFAIRMDRPPTLDTAPAATAPRLP